MSEVTVIKNAVSLDICDFISAEFRMMDSCIDIMNPDAGKEQGMAESFSVYSPLFIETLSLLIQPQVEAAVNKTLYPSYSYGRIYRTGAVLHPHYDRRSSEYTVSVTLDKDDVDWLLCVKHEDDTIERVLLEKGDMLIYPGNKLPHWRKGAFNGNEQIQAFIQYVDANGTNADLKWDGRPAMGLPWDSVSENVHIELEQMMMNSKQIITKDHLD
jgi:hypothetical protein